VLLRALDAGRRAAGAERGDAGLRELVHEAGDERSLRPDHHELHLLFLCQRHQPRHVVGRHGVAGHAVARYAGVAGSGEQLQPLRTAEESAHDRMLTAPSSNDEYAHSTTNPAQSAAMNSFTGIATSDSYLAVPRDPRSRDTLAIVCSSGASMMFTKSKRPRVAHCALTVAPSCSTSLF